MTCQGHDWPRTVGLDIPNPYRFVVRSGHDTAPIKLNAGDAASVTLEGADMALAWEKNNVLIQQKQIHITFFNN